MTALQWLNRPPERRSLDDQESHSGGSPGDDQQKLLDRWNEPAPDDAGKEAEAQLKAEYAAYAPNKEAWKQMVAERTKKLKRKKGVYAIGVVLLLAGFLMEVAGIALP